MAVSTTFAYGDLPRLLSLLTGDEKHSGAANSTLDVLWVLYDRVLRVTPGTVKDPARDRFLLSKGHGPASSYAVLAAKGFIDPDVLHTFGAFDSPLGHHPDRALIPGVEIASGSLGHGLPLAVGMVLAWRRAPKRARASAGRRRGARRRHEQRGDRVRRPARPRATHRRGHRQPELDLRLARRHRAALRGRGLERATVWGETTTRSSARSRRRPDRPHVVAADVSDHES